MPKAHPTSMPAGSPREADSAPLASQAAPLAAALRTAPALLRPQDVLGLQGAVGNRATGRLLAGGAPATSAVAQRLIKAKSGEQYARGEDMPAAARGAAPLAAMAVAAETTLIQSPADLVKRAR